MVVDGVCSVGSSLFPFLSNSFTWALGHSNPFFREIESRGQDFSRINQRMLGFDRWIFLVHFVFLSNISWLIIVWVPRVWLTIGRICIGMEFSFCSSILLICLVSELNLMSLDYCSIWCNASSRDRFIRGETIPGIFRKGFIRRLMFPSHLCLPVMERIVKLGAP